MPQLGPGNCAQGQEQATPMEGRRKSKKRQAGICHIIKRSRREVREKKTKGEKGVRVTK